MLWKSIFYVIRHEWRVISYPLGTRRYYDVELTSLTLIQRRNNVVCPVGKFATWSTDSIHEWLHVITARVCQGQ